MCRLAIIKALAGISDGDILIESSEVFRHELQLIESISVDVNAGAVRTNARQLRSLLFSYGRSVFGVLGFGRFPKQSHREQTYQGTNRK
jgi:hypothetical protein